MTGRLHRVPLFRLPIVSCLLLTLLLFVSAEASALIKAPKIRGIIQSSGKLLVFVPRRVRLNRKSVRVEVVTNGKFVDLLEIALKRSQRKSRRLRLNISPVDVTVRGEYALRAQLILTRKRLSSWSDSFRVVSPTEGSIAEPCIGIGCSQEEEKLASPSPSLVGAISPQLNEGQTRCSAEKEERAVEFTNVERRSRGLSELKVLPELKYAALQRAIVMANESDLDHGDWVNETTSYVPASFGFSRFAQNIASSFQTAPAVVQGWMTSTGHKANIISPLHSHVGIVCLTDGQGKHWWSQNFAGNN